MEELINIYKTLESLGVSRIILDAVVIFGILSLYSSKWQPIIDKIKYRNKLTKQAKADKFIMEELESTKEKILCDRISVYEFHNNNHNLMSKSFMKHSCTYEVCRSGIQGFNISRRDLPNGSSKEVTELINNKKEMIIKDATTYEGSSAFSDYLKNGDIKSLIILPLVSNTTTCGFITIEFLRSTNFDNLNLTELLKESYILVGKVDHKICYGI